jgi:hypothetical protein
LCSSSWWATTQGMGKGRNPIKIKKKNRKEKRREENK